jgi:hypothetical protein
MTSIRYVCPFRSGATGETVDIVVSLEPRELEDVERHRREGHGCGSANGPLAKCFAWNHALRIAPAGFAPIYEQARLVN